MASESVRRRMLLVATGLVIGVAAILALGVIPGVRTHSYPGATPDRAIPALWVFVIVNALVAAALLSTILVTRRGGRASKGLLGAAGLVALAMGFVLLEGAFAYLEERVMQGVAVLLFACVGADLAAGALAFTAVVVRLRQRPYLRQSLRQLWHDIKTHRLATALFLVFWLAIWGIIVSPWDSGIPFLGLYLHLLLALVAGALVGWWRNRSTIADSITGGMLAGLLVCVINGVIEVVLQTLPVLGTAQPNPDTTWLEYGVEALGMGLAYAVIGIAFGMVGGLLGALLAAALRRESRRGAGCGAVRR